MPLTWTRVDPVAGWGAIRPDRSGGYGPVRMGTMTFDVWPVLLRGMAGRSYEMGRNDILVNSINRLRRRASHATMDTCPDRATLGPS